MATKLPSQFNTKLLLLIKNEYFGGSTLYLFILAEPIFKVIILVLFLVAFKMELRYLLRRVLLKFKSTIRQTHSRRIKTLFYKLIIYIAHKFEPSQINNLRLEIRKTFIEIKDYIESTEIEAERVKLENSFLKEKITGLEKAKTSLIEELSGTVDYYFIEFEFIQNTARIIDYLAGEITRLNELIDTAVSVGGNFSELNIERLLRNLSDSHDQINHFKEKAKKADALKIENTGLKNKYSDSMSRNQSIIQEKETQIKKIRKDKTESEQRCHDLQEKLGSKVNELNTLKTSNDSLNSRLDRLSKSEEHERASRKDLEKKLEKSKLESCLLRRKLEESETKKDCIEKKLEELVQRGSETWVIDYEPEQNSDRGIYWAELKRLRRRASHAFSQGAILELHAQDF